MTAVIPGLAGPGGQAGQARKAGRGGLAWILAALLALSAALWLNRAPLAYFDTGGYLDQGRKLHALIGLLPPASNPVPEAGAADPAAQSDDGVVVGTRSAIYAFLLAGFDLTLGVVAMVPLQALVLLGTTLLPARALSRRWPARLSPAGLAGAALLAGCLGAAPFYVAYLMPDIFAPVMILAAGTLLLLLPDLRPWEILAAFLLGAGAATMHPSHLAIALLLVPAALVILLLFRPRRGLLGLLLVAGIPAAALAERAAFAVTAKAVASAEVTYTPFITARLIMDGPGQDLLEEICPRAGFATCELWERLRGQPQRITPTNIIFERDPELGSLALMPPDRQHAVAAEQTAFAREVVLTHPFGVARALLANMASQLGKVSVEMTLPSHDILSQLEVIAGHVPPILKEARLGPPPDRPAPDWLTPLDRVHQAVYAASALLILGLLLARAGPAPVRGLALFVTFGILANALVCGGVSQPADRYGARVAFLLPMLAVFLLCFLPRRGEPPRP